MRIELKRIYEPASSGDGVRILVDRLWPRGVSKDKANIDIWLRDIAPSTEIRRWYNQEPDKWDEFKRRYFWELSELDALVQSILEKASDSKTTLVFASKDTVHNNAIALREYLVQSLPE